MLCRSDGPLFDARLTQNVGVQVREADSLAVNTNIGVQEKTE